MDRSTSSHGALTWAVCTVLLGTATALAVFGPSRRLVWASPLALFVIVTVAATLCLVAAVAVVMAGHRRRLAEVGLLGTGLVVVSILPLVHGLTAPGVLYGPNHAVMTSAFLALPMALGAWSPLALRRRPLGAWAARRWRAWCAVWVSSSVCVAAALLLRPQIRVVPAGTPAWMWALVVAQVAILLVLSHQQLGHYRLSRQASALVASLGLVLLAATTLVWLGSPPYSVGWWLVHGLDIAGVLAGCAGVYRGHRLGRTTTDLLAPVLAHDPLVALEVGLSPVVHRFVAALEAKDPITRDHVVRTAALAVRVGQRIGLSAGRLRALGLGALLHDIGKLETPDELLNKPARLTEDEYRTIQRHTAAGDAIVRTVPALVPIAPLVRGHHERVDGSGYPDALRGESIPLEARIIAVCDAFDAMAHTRQYRQGMGGEKAAAILREHAGSQWDASIVEHVIALAGAGALDDGAFATVGRAVLCDCADALPDTVVRQFALDR